MTLRFNAFNQTSAVAYDGTRTSQDVCLKPLTTSLDARDLIMEFTGLHNLVAPLNQLQNQCSATRSKIKNIRSSTRSGSGVQVEVGKIKTKIFAGIAVGSTQSNDRNRFGRLW